MHRAHARSPRRLRAHWHVVPGASSQARAAARGTFSHESGFQECFNLVINRSLDPAAPVTNSILWQTAEDAWGEEGRVTEGERRALRPWRDWVQSRLCGRSLLVVVPPRGLGMSRGGRKDADIDVYRRLRQIGEGTYGKVYLCEEREERGGVRKQVAIKKVMIAAGKEGFPQTAVREIKLLALLRHENIVRLEHIVTPPKADREAGDTIYMVFEYLDHDLAGLIRDPRVNFDAYQIKWFMKQLVEGLKHCHDQGVLHRDIKASNILIDNFGNLKLGEVGLVEG